MKKFLSMILALAMVFSLAMPAMAAEPTVTGNKEGDVTASYTPSGYAVNVGETVNGTVTADKQYANEGDYITVNITPAEGYEADTFTYVDSAGNSADITYTSHSNTYYFYMPASDVTINVTFRQKPVITGVTISVMDNGEAVEPVEGVYTITPRSTVKFTISGVNFAALDNRNYFSVTQTNVGGYITAENGWTIDTAANTATKTASGTEFKDIEVTADVEYSNDGLVTYIPSGIKLQYRVTYYVNFDNGADYNVPVTAVSYNPWMGTYGEAYSVTHVEGNIYSATMPGTVSVFEFRDSDGNPINTFTVPTDGTNMYSYSTNGWSHYPPMTSNVLIDSAITNGTVTADKTTAYAGDWVTLTITPDEGFALESLTIDGNGIDIANVVGNTYGFTMPAADVTVTATFKALEAEITGLSITIDGVEYDRTNTSETNPAVITPNTQSLTLKVTGTNLQYNEHAIVSYAPSKNADTVHARNEWIVSEDGTSATKDISAFLEVLSSTTSVWELQYANDGDTLESSGVYVIYQVPTYAVNISAAIAGGTVTASPNPAEEGQTVTVTVEAEAGYAYVVGSLKVINEATGLEVPVDEASKTFMMPDSTVMVSAEFEELTVTSAEIVWGSMAFTYTDEAGAWSADTTAGAGTVTVKNTGDNTFAAQPVYTAEADYDEIDGKFYNSAAPETPTTMGFVLDSDETVTFILKLVNKPEKAIPAGTKIGTVTITIQEGAPE